MKMELPKIIISLCHHKRKIRKLDAYILPHHALVFIFR